MERFGCCDIMVSDQGRELVNQMKENLYALTGTLKQLRVYFSHNLFVQIAVANYSLNRLIGANPGSLFTIKLWDASNDNISLTFISQALPPHAHL